jgi:hypothetical protein
MLALMDCGLAHRPGRSSFIIAHLLISGHNVGILDRVLSFSSDHAHWHDFATKVAGKKGVLR